MSARLDQLGSSYRLTLLFDGSHSYPLIVPVASHASGSQLLIQLFTGNVASMADKELLIKTIHRFSVRGYPLLPIRPSSGSFGQEKIILTRNEQC